MYGLPCAYLSVSAGGCILDSFHFPSPVRTTMAVKWRKKKKTEKVAQ